jgi:hypothetical protein
MRVAPNFIMLNNPEDIPQYYKWNRSNYTLALESSLGEAGVIIQADVKKHAQ